MEMEDVGKGHVIEKLHVAQDMDALLIMEVVVSV